MNVGTNTLAIPILLLQGAWVTPGAPVEIILWSTYPLVRDYTHAPDVCISGHRGALTY